MSESQNANLIPFNFNTFQSIISSHLIIGRHGDLAGAARAVRVGRGGLAVDGARVRVARGTILVVVADLRILTRKSNKLFNSNNSRLLASCRHYLR